MDIPGKNHSEGRNQRLLDLSRAEVQDYIIGDVYKRQILLGFICISVEQISYIFQGTALFESNCF